MGRVTPKWLVFWLTCLTCVGCGDEAGGGDGEISAAPREGYVGCYGTTEGSIIANLEFESPDGSPFTLGDVYVDGRNRLLMLSASAGWCQVCIAEQPWLATLHEQFAEEGLFILVGLFEDESFQPADAEFAAQWRDQYELPFTVVADPTYQLSAYYDATRSTLMTMFVDVETMTILRITTGHDTGLAEAIIESRLR